MSSTVLQLMLIAAVLLQCCCADAAVVRSSVAQLDAAVAADVARLAPTSVADQHTDMSAVTDDSISAQASKRRSKDLKLQDRPLIDDNDADDGTDEDGGDTANNAVDIEAMSANRRRQNKMFDFYGSPAGYYAPPAALYPSPYVHPYFTQGFYNAPTGYPSAYASAEVAAVDDDDDDADDLMGRANRRRPAAQGGGAAAGSQSGSPTGGSSSQNSPIFYIRLPPTPYMYVPGMGYISQPPSIRPLAQQFLTPAPPPPPPPPPQHLNPFIQVPVSFLANGKPTNVYEWPSPQQQHQQQQHQQQLHHQQQQHQHSPMWNPAGGGGGSFAGGGGYPPAYLPARPLQPSRAPGYRPAKPQYLPDSKITHLKGPYIFNGRPEEIFVLPSDMRGPPQHYQSYHPAAHHPHSNPYHMAGPGAHQQSGEFEQPSYNHLAYRAPPPLPYGDDGYNSIYSNGLYRYY